VPSLQEIEIYLFVPGVLLAGFLADQFGILWIFFVTSIVLWITIPFFLTVPEIIKCDNA